MHFRMSHEVDLTCLNDIRCEWLLKELNAFDRWKSNGSKLYLTCWVSCVAMNHYCILADWNELFPNSLQWLRFVIDFWVFSDGNTYCGFQKMCSPFLCPLTRYWKEKGNFFPFQLALHIYVPGREESDKASPAAVKLGQEKLATVRVDF